MTADEIPELGSFLRRVGIALVVVVLGIVGTCWFSDRGPRRNVAICDRIQPGITIDSLVTVLTGPDYHTGYRGSRVHFDTPNGASESIEAKYDSTTRRVMELNCGDGPRWKIEQ